MFVAALAFVGSAGHAQEAERAQEAGTVLAAIATQSPSSALWLRLRLSDSGDVVPREADGPTAALQHTAWDLDGDGQPESVMMAHVPGRAIIAILTGSAPEYRVRGCAWFVSDGPPVVSVIPWGATRAPVLIGVRTRVAVGAVGTDAGTRHAVTLAVLWWDSERLYRRLTVPMERDIRRADAHTSVRATVEFLAVADDRDAPIAIVTRIDALTEDSAPYETLPGSATRIRQRLEWHDRELLVSRQSTLRPTPAERATLIHRLDAVQRHAEALEQARRLVADLAARPPTADERASAGALAIARARIARGVLMPTADAD